MVRLCADAVAHGADWVHLEMQVKVSIDLRIIFG